MKKAAPKTLGKAPSVVGRGGVGLMTKEIRAYLAFILGLLTQNDPATDWRVVERELLIRIRFYQHERLIHLLVTFGFAFLIAVGIIIAIQFVTVFWVVGLMLVLEVAYIGHYYFLENSVQKLYKYYYQVLEKAKAMPKL